jgi:hypothetical protein
MKIESYESYRVGVRLNPNVRLDDLENKMKKVLEEKQYEVVKESEIGFPGFPMRMEEPVDILGAKSGTRVELNFFGNMLNAVGEKPNDVNKILDEIISFLPNLGYELEATIMYYEISANMIVKSDETPRRILNGSSKVDLESMRKLIDVDVIGMRIGNAAPREIEGIELVIEPSPVSPSNRFFVRLRYRSKEIKKIKALYAELDTIILRTMNSLEGT